MKIQQLSTVATSFFGNTKVLRNPGVTGSLYLLLEILNEILVNFAALDKMQKQHFLSNITHICTT